MNYENRYNYKADLPCGESCSGNTQLSYVTPSNDLSSQDGTRKPNPFSFKFSN